MPWPAPGAPAQAAWLDASTAGASTRWTRSGQRSAQSARIVQRMTAPSVASSIFTAQMAGIDRDPCTHWLTREASMPKHFAMCAWAPRFCWQ
jgi:hypothetical protein